MTLNICSVEALGKGAGPAWEGRRARGLLWEGVGGTGSSTVTGGGGGWRGGGGSESETASSCLGSHNSKIPCCQ